MARRQLWSQQQSQDSDSEKSWQRGAEGQSNSRPSMSVKLAGDSLEERDPSVPFLGLRLYPHLQGGHQDSPSWL